MIKKTICVFDSGMCQSLAHRLAREFERVLYYFRNADFAVDPFQTQIGKGYDDIERITDWESREDEIDVWCFPYVYNGALQDKLRREGRQVWGAGSKGEAMELERWEMIELMEEIGLPLPKSQLLTGMIALRAFLEENDDQVVKVSHVRGLTETFTSKNYEQSKTKLLDIEHSLGAMAEIQDFVVQTKLESLGEVGYDGYCIDGEFPTLAQWGLERKDEAYAAEIVPYSGLSRNIRIINDKLKAPMKAFGFRGFFYTEAIIGKDKKPYLIDPTCRMGSPSGECFMELCENLGEIIEAGSRGELVQIKQKAKCAVQVSLRSDFVKKNWLPIQMPENVRQWIKLVTSTKINGMEVIVPQQDYDDIVGCAVGIGSTLKEAHEKCVEHAKQVEAYGIYFHESEIEKAVDGLMESKRKNL